MTRRVFFLGAGFSKALNPLYPTLAELTDSVCASFSARYIGGAVREHFNNLPAGMSSDIEQLLSFLHSDWPWKSSIDRDLDNALYKALVYEIATVLADIPPARTCREYRQFIQYLRVTEENSVISVNYDDLVEEYRDDSMSCKDYPFLDNLFVRVEERFEAGRKTSEETPWLFEKTDAKSQPRIIFAREWLEQNTLEDYLAVFDRIGYAPEKPSWSSMEPKDIWRITTSQNDVPFRQKKVDLALRADVPPHRKVLHLHGALHWDADIDSPTIRVKNSEGNECLVPIPAIVPPVMDKSRHYAAGRLKDAWNSAHASIRSAEEIVVIGFSFPPTDISCQFLFKSAISPGTRIVVVNRDTGIKSRYQTAFGAIPELNLDFAFVNPNDPLLEYVRAEVLKMRHRPTL